VLVGRRPDQDQLRTWSRGVVLAEGVRSAPASVRLERTEGHGAWLRVLMREGRKREIRDIGARVGLPIVRILRVRIGGLPLGSLRPGQWRVLTPEEARSILPGATGRAGGRERRPATRRPSQRPSSRRPRPGGSPSRGPRMAKRRRHAIPK
jgi:23S rRNA pseudouridine2605 synthase